MATPETLERDSTKLSQKSHRILDEEVHRARGCRFFGDITLVLKFADGNLATVEKSKREVVKAGD